MPKDRRKPSYKIGYKYLLNHIEELEERLDQKDDLIERLKFLYIETEEERGVDERTATREIYQTIYFDKWKNYIDGKFLTQEENEDWFDDNHDSYVCRSPYDENYLSMAQYETGIFDRLVNGQLVKGKDTIKFN